MLNKTLITIALVMPIFLTSSVHAEELVISGNGSGSSSEIHVTSDHPATVNQTNSAEVQNNVTANSNTGGNSANNNSGNTSIQTGNTSSNTEVSSSANSSNLNLCCPSPTPAGSVTISGNGANSQNNVNVTSNNQTNVTITQLANIQNNITVHSNTGNNITNNNSGNISITTGNIAINNEIKNSPVNNYHVLAGVGLTSDFTIKIFGNGANSTNQINLINQNDNNITVFNTATIDNVLNVLANTGGNSANNNSGSVLIKTGDITMVNKILNDPINVGDVSVCCQPTPPPPPGGGGSTPPPTTTPPPSSTSPGSGSGSGSGSGTSSGGSVLGAATGQILPATGSVWTIILTLLSALMFLMGLYLRLHPGQDPG